MKNIFSIILMVCVLSDIAVAQNSPNNQTAPAAATATPLVLPATYTYTSGQFNFTRTFIPQVPITSTSSPVFSLSAGGSAANYTATVQTTYTNGLGNALETIKRGAPEVSGAVSSDIIIPIDNRPSLTANSFLPYSASVGTQFQATPFTAQKTYYTSNAPHEGSTSYSQSISSFSSTNTLTVQSYAPGSSFIGHARGAADTTAVYGAADIPMYAYVGGVLTNEGTYPIGALNIKTATDNSGSVTKGYYDKNNRLVCKAVYAGANSTTKWLTTYYVYDDLGRLIYMLTPKEVATGVSSHAALGYTYNYDGYGNIISSNTPGKLGSDVDMYDSRHRCVLAQSPLMKGSNQYLFQVYDSRDRIILSGIYTSTRTNVSLQAILNNPSGYTFASTSLLYYLVNGITPYQYPASIDSCEIDAINYYDQYPTTFLTGAFNTTFVPDYLTGVNMLTPTPYLFTQGMLTASQVRVKDPANNNLWTSSKYFYDQKGHAIQVQMLSPWNHTTPNVITMQYNFAGQMVQQINAYTDTTTSYKQQTAIATVYNYDIYHDGRLLSVQQRVDTAAWRYLSTYQYDDLGRVKQKMLGGVEEQDYTYNIRGQLLGINSDYAQATPEASLNKTFGEYLGYDYGFTVPRYDGNLAGVVWRGGGSGAQLRSYSYVYDTVKRLTAADFYQGASGGTWVNNVMDYTMDSVTYDQGGNILSMHQKGTTGSIVDIDRLKYNYTSGTNQLSGVQDLVTANYNLGDFVNGSCPTCGQYMYDADGNLVSDANKQISQITYSPLDKPQAVTFQNGATITNVYDAKGSLLKKTLDSAGHITVIRYWGPFVYQNDSLQYILHNEGRARWLADSNKFAYDYFVKDHSGSVRNVVTADVTPPLTYFAGHELAAANVETSLFTNIDNVRDLKLGSIDTSDDMAARLNGSDPSRTIGTAIFLQVMAGDQFNISAQSYWQSSGTTNYDAPYPMMEAVLATLSGGINNAGGNEATIQSELNAGFSSVNYNLYENLLNTIYDPAAPRAFINYVVFDASMHPVLSSSGAVQVGPTAGVWQTIQTANPVVAPVNGYIAIYMSNEQLQNVYMDELSITCTKGRLLQEQHYYPFGLAVNDGASTNVLANKYLYQGNEVQSNYGLNQADFDFRQYDYQVGRFTGLDLLASQGGQEGLSPYHFCDNNPANFVDPTGLADGIKVINTYGQASMVLTNDDLYGSLESWITDIYAWWILAAPPQDGGGSAQSNTLDNSNLAPMSNIAGPDMPTRSSSGPTGPDAMSQISSMIAGNYSLSGSANASVGIGIGGGGGHSGGAANGSSASFTLPLSGVGVGEGVGAAIGEAVSNTVLATGAAIAGAIVGIFLPANYGPSSDHVAPPIIRPSALTINPEDLPWPSTPVPPLPGYIWRGNGAPGSGQGNWIGPDGTKIHPDFNHPLPKPPHWGVTNPDGTEGDVDSNGVFHPTGIGVPNWW